MEKIDMEKLIEIKTQITIFKWLLGGVGTAILGLGIIFGSWASAQSKDVSNLKQINTVNVEVHKNQKEWLKDNSTKIENNRNNSTEIKKDTGYNRKTLEEIKKLLWEVHKKG